MAPITQLTGVGGPGQRYGSFAGRVEAVGWALFFADQSGPRYAFGDGSEPRYTFADESGARYAFADESQVP